MQYLLKTKRADNAPIQPRDVARWLTFTSFWGFISYMLACASMAAASKQQPVKLNMPTAAAGLGLHTASFMALGSAAAATAALVQGRSTTDISEERIGGGELERPQNILVQGASTAVGSLAMLAMAFISQRAAAELVGKPAFSRTEAIDLPRAGLVMAILSGLTAMAVTRITGWVARDSRVGAAEQGRLRRKGR